MKTPNPYKILGIDKNATPDQIKKAYRALAKQHHPDTGGDPALFREIQGAHDLLEDPVARENYDRDGVWSEKFQPTMPEVFLMMAYEEVLPEVVMKGITVPLSLFLRSTLLKWIDIRKSIIKGQNYQLDQLAAHVERVSCKGGRDPLAFVHAAVKRDMLHVIEYNEAQVADINAALEILDNYDFDGLRLGSRFMISWGKAVTT
jgi:hypothetical protein